MDSTTMSHACVNCGHNTRSNTIAVPVSPVPHLLNTNYSPSQTEVGLIRTSISQVHADIAEIDYELASLQAATAQIQRKRRLLLSFSEGHKSLLSPVRRIAPETLSDIFMWCLMEFWEDLFASCDYTRICLSHVCRFWRDVALSTPKMWAWIGLAMKSEHEQSQVAMTKTWLTRSSRHPLTLRVIPPVWGELQNTYVHSVMEAILPHSTHWEDVRFLISSAMLDTLITVNDLPCLQNLAIDTFDFNLVSQPLLFDNAPGLRCVELGYNVSSAQSFPWAQLTEYWLDNTTAHEILAILDQTPHLVKCTVRVLEDETPLHRHVRLPLLQSLEITSYINPADLFNHLSLPALRDFRYGEREEAAEEGWPNSQFVALVKRSSCLLQTLNIDGILTEGDLIDCLRSMPLLVTQVLTLGEASYITSETLSRLTNREASSDQCLVPGLEYLNIQCYGALNSLAWVDMIESRWRLDGVPYGDEGARVSRLKRVAMHWNICEESRSSSKIALHTFERLRHFKSEGLVVFFTYGYLKL